MLLYFQRFGIIPLLCAFKPGENLSDNPADANKIISKTNNFILIIFHSLGEANKALNLPIIHIVHLHIAGRHLLHIARIERSP